MLLLRVALWDCLLTDWPYRAPVADTHPDENEYAPCGEPLVALEALPAALQELFDGMHGEGAATCDVAPVLAYFRAMSPWLSRTAPVRYFTPYVVRGEASARHWCAGICISRELLDVAAR